MNNVNLDETIQTWMNDRPTQLPESVSVRIDAVLAALPERRIRQRTRTLAVAASILAASLVGVFVLAFVSPALASTLQQIPGMASVFQRVGDTGLKAAVDKGLTAEIGQSVTDQGITITLNEVVYDGSRLAIGLIQQAEAGVAQIKDSNSVQVKQDKGVAQGVQDFWNVAYKIDGKRVHFAGSGTGNQVDDSTYIELRQLFPDKELPKQFELTVDITQVGAAKGNWSFTVPVKKKDDTNKTAFPLVSQTDGTEQLTVTKVVFTPTSTTVDVILKMPVSSNLSMKKQHIWDYLLTDEIGTTLEPLGAKSTTSQSSSKNPVETSQYQLMFGPVQHIPKQLTLRPFIRNLSDSKPVGEETRVRVERAPDAQHPILLDQGEIGNLQITGVDYLKDKTVVHYETSGLDPYLQAHTWWIEDEAGNSYAELAGAKQVDSVKHQFIGEFAAFAAGEKLTFATRQLHFIKGLEITFPVLP